MSHDHDHPTERPFFADPNARVGGLVYRLSESEYAGYAGFVGFLVLIGAVYAAATGPEWAGLPAIIIGIVGMLGGMAVGEASTDRICPDCEYPQPESNRYCASCGVNFEEVDER